MKSMILSVGNGARTYYVNCYNSGLQYKGKQRVFSIWGPALPQSTRKVRFQSGEARKVFEQINAAPAFKPIKVVCAASALTAVLHGYPTDSGADLAPIL